MTGTTGDAPDPAVVAPDPAVVAPDPAADAPDPAVDASDPAADAGTVRVACCQLAPRLGDVEANRAASLSAIEAAARQGARVVVLPELVVTGYAFTDPAQARAVAEPVGPVSAASGPMATPAYGPTVTAASGPTVTAWTQAAGRLGVVVVGGLCELGADGQLYNSAVIVDGSGLRAAHRKTHLWDREKLIFTPGEAGPPVVDLAGVRIGVMICYEVEFPEYVRLAGLAGADLLCVPANWPRSPRPAGERPMEVVRVQAAAGANRVFVAAADRAGAERGVDWVGGSVIVDPDGWPLAGPDPGDHELTLLADCDLTRARTKTISDHNDVLADRRPALYGPILEERAP